MVIDSSAVVAIILAEPGYETLSRAIADAEQRIMSAVSVFEASMIAANRFGNEGSARVGEALRLGHIIIMSFGQEQLSAARTAWLTYGKGRHKARLNFGDCIAYALAKTRNEPLLYKGDDFSLTDIRSAI